MRYPGGQERRIRYPISDAEDDNVLSLSDPYRSFAEECQPDRWGPEDISDLWSGLFDEPTASAASSAAAAAPAILEPPQQEAEDSLDIFDQLTSSDYKEAQRQYWERISSSDQILDGCPWVVPKPLHVLAVARPSAPHAAMFTLQTRISHAQVESELSKVLGRRRADGGPLLSVDSLVEGIVCFEEEVAAEAFGHALEAEGHQDVGLATCDSHELFRLSTSSAAVVVLLKQGGEPLTPGELEVSLRRQRRNILD